MDVAQQSSLLLEGRGASSLLALLDKISDEHGWMAEAACRDLPTEWFFPPNGVMPVKAKNVCFGCPVNAECWEAGKDELYGVWAGTSVEERRDIRMRRAS